MTKSYLKLSLGYYKKSQMVYSIVLAKTLQIYNFIKNILHHGS